MPPDPVGEPPWAMQLAVRAEKAEPPAHSAVCEAAAMAVVRLLADPRSAADGDPAGPGEPAAPGAWYAAVHRWESGRIRKVTRRARSVRWAAVQALPGVTVGHAGAWVRAFVPGPVTDVPTELAKLQVAGLDLADDAVPEPPPDVPYGAIALNPGVPMTTGKAAAQAAHAAHLLLRQDGPGSAAWVAGGLEVRLVRQGAWRECVGRAAVVVRDAGYTEVPPGTMTAIGRLVR